MVWIAVLGCSGPATDPEVSTDGPSTEPIVCEEALLFDGVGLGAGVETGFVRCSDGAINRAEVRDTIPTGAQIPTCDMVNVYDYSCTEDADCAGVDGGPDGVCGQEWVGGSDACHCEYPCERDADCGQGQACLQSWTQWGRPHCVSVVDCFSDADCPSGQCGLIAWTPSVGTALTLACRTDDDECRSNADCDPGQQEFCGDQDTWSCYFNGYD